MSSKRRAALQLAALKYAISGHAMSKGCLTTTTTSPPTQKYPARGRLTQNSNKDTITGKTLPVHTDHEILQQFPICETSDRLCSMT